MKFLNIIFLSIAFIFGSCGRRIDDDSVPIADSTFNDNKNYELSDKHNNYDSAQFKITKFFFISGKLYYEGYSDTVEGTILEKYYRYDGGLFYEGKMDLENRFHIGTWKYYYPDGRIKKINFDSTEQISSEKALKIAKSYGFNKGRLEIREELFEGTYYWHVTEWTEEDSQGGKGKYLMIRRSNGAVTIPKPNDTTYFI
ncbi:hypothetical protein CNR22_01225 [Sphingobacteriaceae bacterium]|nr:hypothetical protein CNR22_01225 [Sphingobacteriaceae bacterium]